MRKKRGPNRRLSVTVGDDFETFQHGDDDLAWHTFAGDGAISDVNRLRIAYFFAALFRHRRVGMGSLQTLIAAVDNGRCLRI
jgi:hypothetical protein